MRKKEFLRRELIMSKKVRIIANDGIGGILQGFNIAHYVKLAGNEVDVALAVRDDVFFPLKYLFGDQFKISLLPEEWANKIEKDENIWAEVSAGYDETFFFEPDLLHLNKHAFDYKKYNISLNTIKQTRLLQHKHKPEKIIYIATNTSTPEYHYAYTPILIKFIAEMLPDYQIYYNNVIKWAGHNLDNGDFSNLPSNVLYFKDQSFEESLGYLYRSCYCLSVDNGISHISHSLSQNRTVISNRFNNLEGQKWVARWLENTDECISYNHSPISIAQLIKLNIELPQTTLIPRENVINNLDKDFKQVLYFKH